MNTNIQFLLPLILERSHAKSRTDLLLEGRKFLERVDTEE